MSLNHLGPKIPGQVIAERLGFAAPISGIKIEGVVRYDKPRALDLSARKARKFDKLPNHLRNEVLPQVVKFE